MEVRFLPGTHDPIRVLVKIRALVIKHSMLKKLSPKSAILLFIIGLAIGLLITSQFRTPPRRITDRLAPYLAIEQTHQRLQAENAHLKNQLKNIRDEIKISQTQAIKRKTTIRDLVEIADQLKQTAGLTEASGTGLVITLDDSRKGEPTADNIIHAADVRDLVNALWVAGAKAISINNERLVTVSSIDSIGITILVNNVRMNPPLAIRVIGDSGPIEQYVNSTPTLADLRQRSKNLGLLFNIEKVADVTVDEFTGTFSITQAKVKD